MSTVTPLLSPKTLILNTVEVNSRQITKNAFQIHPVNLVKKQAVLCQLGLWAGLSQVAGCW